MASNHDAKSEAHRQAVPILRTKLYRPPVTADLVPRERLLELLDHSFEVPLTLVSAPAGYGKSVLVSHWAERQEHPSAWLSLDRTDSDLWVFLAYLLAAVDTVSPGACRATGELLLAPEPQPVPVLATRLINDLDAIDTPLPIVLDDYHRLAPASPVHQLVEALLEHPPRQVHLVLITRRDPPFPLAVLRANNRIAEVRLQDLHFTGPETAEFLAAAAEVAVGPRALANLQREVEGWAAGLRLVSLALRGVEDSDGFLEGLHGGLPQTREYLLREVLAGQTSELRDGLLATSILDRLCAELIDVVCRSGDLPAPSLSGRSFLEAVRRRNLFVVSLDADGEWFRYHHLFKELLEDELRRVRSAEDVAILNRRAGDWLAAQGSTTDALRHFLASGDVGRAVELVERQRHVPMDTEQWHRLERWLGLLPAEARDRSPRLMSARAFLFEYGAQVAAAMAHRDRAEALLAELPPDAPEAAVVRGEVAVLKGVEALFSGRGELAIEFAHQAADSVPDDALHVRSYIVGVSAIGHQAAGDLARGSEIIDAASGSRAASSGFFQARITAWRCLAHMAEGTLAAVGPAARRCIELGSSLDLPESTGFGHYFLGAANYLRNELAAAERHLTALLGQRYTCRPAYFAQGSFILALIHLRRGRPEAAAEVVEAVIEQIAAANNPPLLHLARAFEVELVLRQGRIEEARLRSAGVDFNPYPPIWLLFVPQLTPVKLLLAEGSAADLDQAIERLAELDEFLRAAHRKTVRIEALGLAALAHEARGEQSVALEKLALALALAEPGGILRSLVDLGPPMADLLRRVLERRTDSVFARQVLAVFAADELAASGPTPVEPATPPPSRELPVDLPASGPTPVEPATPPPSRELPVDLPTNREQQILELLAQRLSDKEIAADLGVSPTTVKSHLRNLYQKLQVGNRRRAVSEAGALGLLPRR